MARPGPVGGQYQPLTEDQIKQVHRASLTVLERTGFHVENEEALALYQQGGARVDGHRVYITPPMVEEALNEFLQRCCANWQVDRRWRISIGWIRFARSSRHDTGEGAALTRFTLHGQRPVVSYDIILCKQEP